jgi:aspartate/methionine/tyrosine aminotransferase
VLQGVPPRGAFYAFVRIASEWQSPEPDAPASPSWAMAQHLITRGRIGCVPGLDFGSAGEGYVRFCFARDRRELSGALESLQTTLSATA